MHAVLFRLALLAGGIGLAEMAIDSLAHGADVALIQFALALILLGVGFAGFIVPRSEGGVDKEALRRV